MNKIFLSLSFSVLFLGCFSAASYNGKLSRNFDGEKFHNLEKTEMKSFWDLIVWKLTTTDGYWPSNTNDVKQYKPNSFSKNLQISFIGHSTFLIQLDSINILTDPIWSERASPVSFVGPKRCRIPAINFSDLPKIDYVVISHNHYDHLDIETLKKLKVHSNPTVCVPLGVDLFLKEESIENVIAMNWWEEKKIKSNFKINFLPSRHFSGRGFTDMNETLWGSWIIISDTTRIYFAGDTGFGIHFEQIANRFPNIEVSLLPIGAFKPRFFMEQIHISPDEAVKSHIILKSKKSIAMHFGTFSLADDAIDEPIIELEKSLLNRKISKENFLIPKFGEPIFFDK